MVLTKRTPSGIFGSKGEKVRGGQRELHGETHQIFSKAKIYLCLINCHTISASGKRKYSSTYS
jgi:hypothetical protein